MISNYLKIALRNLSRNRTFSVINIFGLAIGIACAGMIFLWVEDELNFDGQHAKKDKLFIVKVNQVYDTYTATFSSTPGVMGPALQEDIPGIKRACRVTEEQASLLFNVGDKALYASGLYAEPAIFDLFTFPFVEGNPATALKSVNSIVLTESSALKFFGKTSGVIGSTVRVDKKDNYVVSAVIKDIPKNSSLTFEWLAPFEVYYQRSPWAQKWSNSCLSTFVELNDGVAAAQVDGALYDYLQKKEGLDRSTSHAFLFGMGNWHLYNEFENGKLTGSGRIQYVHLFTLIAWIILLIACINFMNLSTARSEKRAREVGVRKVMGAGRQVLIGQFIGEALFMAMIGMVVAVILMALALQPFNELVQKQLVLGLGKPVHIAVLMLITVLCGAVAGSYPAIYLSSFRPVWVLKGIRIPTGGAAMIRKGLVVAQFAISVILIISTIIIYQQIQHVKSRNLGFNKNNLIQLDLQGDMLKNFEPIKQDLLNTGDISNAALADHETIYDGNNTDNVTWAGKDPSSRVLISQRLVSPEFMSVAGMQIIEGRDFRPSDVRQLIVNKTGEPTPVLENTPFNVMITESLARQLGKGSAIGKPLQLPGQVDGKDLNLVVTGVIKDYVYGDMYGQSSPVIFYCIPQLTTFMYVRMKPGHDPEQVLAKMSSILKQENPGYPFQYRFVDDQFNALFLNEMLISKLSRVFSMLTIFISCLGLFGLAAYTAERRRKEIGIRRVLGASVGSVSALLSREFLSLVMVSCLIAFPVAWWIMSRWLQGYAYRLSISPWVFVGAAMAAMAISLITVLFQTQRAALANPTKSLRSE